MSFTDASESFFLDAVESTSRPVVQVLPLNDTAVFEYLDAHPDALSRYLTERSGLCQFFGGSFAQNDNTHDGPAFENVISHAAGEPEGLEESDGAIQEIVLRHVMVVAQPVDEEGDVCIGMAYEVADGEEVVDCHQHREYHEHQGHPKHQDHHEDHDGQGEDSDSDSDGDSNGDEDGLASNYESNEGSEDGCGGENSANAISNDVSSRAGPRTTPSSTPPSPASNNGADEGDGDHSDNEKEQEEELMPYPAPASLVAASRLEQPTRSWALWEEEACIRHMLNINSERQLKGEARFREALHRMQLYDGVRRTGYSAVKNFWNRVGRARSRFDERRNKKAPLATSQQGKRTKRKSSSLLSQRRRSAWASDLKMKARNTRHRRPPKCSTDEDESEDSLQSEKEEPIHLHHPPKRKDPDDDGDDERRPGSIAANALGRISRPSGTACAA